MNGVAASTPEKLGLTDEPAADTYLQQLRGLDAHAVGNPILSRVVLLTATKLLRLGNRIEAHIATEWDEAPPADAFKRTKEPIEALLKLARQADRYIRLSDDLQSDEPLEYPGQPR